MLNATKAPRTMNIDAAPPHSVYSSLSPAFPYLSQHHAPMQPSVIILSFNRRDALARTLRELAVQGLTDITVVDNASADGTTDLLARDFPAIRVIALPSNVGITGYNIGVRRAAGEYVLVLDDDSWPDAGAVHAAADFLAANTDTAAVALLPTHPGTRRSEWPFAPAVSRSGWPVMGCGNLVRRTAWEAVGGYEELFFLYRNDTDLAMKLLASSGGVGTVGGGVHFNPAWIVWHDSPAAARKSERWLRFATRNWLWMCARHGRGVWGVFAQCAGVLWAARHAGLSVRRLGAVWYGTREGLTQPAPNMPATVNPDGSALRELMRLRLRPGGQAHAPRTNPSIAPHSP